MISNNKYKFNFFLMSFLFLHACSSSLPKADLPRGADPQQELTRLNTDIMNGDVNNFAVLAAEDFAKAKVHGQRAEESIKNGAPREKQIEELRVARGYLQRANRKATERRSEAEPILETRELAVNAGALQYPNTRARIDEVDKEAQKLVRDEDSLTPGQIQHIQKQYNDVHVQTLETIHLSGVRSILEDAKKRDAESVAPRTLQQTQVDYVNAKNAIFVHRTNPNGFQTEVKRAISMADTLSRVLDKAENTSGAFSESEAVRTVWQERQIEELQAENRSQAEEVEALSEPAPNPELDLQNALRAAQTEFEPHEAEVYEQDNKLLIRLKAIRFQKGSAEIPERSQEVLTKVQEVVEGLNPSQVVVQGHADATGNSDQNFELSEQRAAEVAEFLKENGIQEEKIVVEAYGDSKPVSSNKTANGRAENRRIDIMVIPGYAQR